MVLKVKYGRRFGTGKKQVNEFVQTKGVPIKAWKQHFKDFATLKKRGT